MAGPSTPMDAVDQGTSSERRSSPRWGIRYSASKNGDEGVFSRQDLCSYLQLSTSWESAESKKWVEVRLKGKIDRKP